MIVNKKIKMLLSIITVLIMLVSIGANLVYAADSTLTAKLSNSREVKENGVYVTKDGYLLNSDTAHPVFQIMSVDGSTKTGTNLFCLNATAGATWNDENAGTGAEVTYNKGYDLTNAEDIETVKGLVSTYSDVVNGAYYEQIMWILDNMYVADSDSMTVAQLLAKAGIRYTDIGTMKSNLEPTGKVYNYDLSSPIFSTINDNSNLIGYSDGYWYEDAEGNVVDVVLPKELVEVVEQAAIWYFTNYKQNSQAEYNCYTTEGSTVVRKWLRYADKSLLSNKTITVGSNEINIGEMYQEQAAILFNYLVDGANAAAAAEGGYKASTKGTIDLTVSGDKIVEDGDNYKVGPLKVAITGNTTIKTNTLTVTTGTSNTDITSFATLPSTVTAGTDFYITVPKSKVDGNVKVSISADTNWSDKKLWVKTVTDNANAEQPIVEVVPQTDLISDEVTVTPTVVEIFDLALRKTITKVGNSTTIKNEENKDARRTITTVLTDLISGDSTTATYKHRKDPVVVKTGDVVTYELTIYNEGGIDGYPSKIVDQLPTGLTSNLSTGDTITSSKGNIYDVVYDTTTNKVTLTLKTKTKDIKAFDGETLDSDKFVVTATVNQEPATDGATKKYLTNIAYIAEAKNKDGEVQAQDRNNTESKPSVAPNNNKDGLNSTNANSYKGKTTNKSVYADTNNSEYYEGQEDDDDFEKVVVLPKDFDLKLMKFIAEINGKTQNRTITIDSTRLNSVINNKKVTTANYDVTKVPLLVKTGEYVTYTFRIYNEGEIDGYASEISEDIPEGLKFVTSSDSNLTDEDNAAIAFNTAFGWAKNNTLSTNGKTVISTDYLSKEAGTAAGRDNLIKAFDSENDDGKGSGLDYRDISVMLKVISTDNTGKVIRNEAAITDDEDKDGNEVTDRDSTPEEWKKEDSDEYYEDNNDYPKYNEDDEDYDNIKLASFDLSLRKFITKISKDGDFANTKTTKEYNRVPDVDTSKLKAGTAETAIYNHSKEPIYLNVGDYVLYTIRVYNEGDFDGYASEITDYLPENLGFVTHSENEYINNINSKWEYDASTGKVTTKATAENATTLLKAFDRENDNEKGSGLSYVDMQIVCRVNSKTPANKKLTNIAEISEYKDEDKNEVRKDRDSSSDNLEYPENPETYKDDELDKQYVPGQEDDDDFEKVIVRRPGKYDVVLIKEDENGEQLDSKATFEVNNETKEVVGELVIADDVEINASNLNTPDTYIIKETIPPDEYCEFDGIITIAATKKISDDEKSYELDKLEYAVTDKDGNPFDTTDAKVYLKDGNIYVEVKDYQKKNFDLALRKFITDISGKEVTTRIPDLEYKDGKIVYKHPKNVLKVVVGDVVTYTLRVFNEGEIAGFAEKISDDIPEYLEYLPDNATNKEYMWKMYDKDNNETTDVTKAVKIVTDYTSKANGEALMEANSELTENPYLLNAFDPTKEISDTNPEYVDVKVAFKVKDPGSKEYIIVNKAQISEDADENGDDIDDIDSIPDKWNDGEDDQDYENVSVEYFDLALLKYVSKAIVIEDGKTTTTKTGNNGSKDDIMPKVEIYRKNVNSVIVKFEYVIKITNEGDIAGYATEITDYVPKGLKFYAEDNEGWKDEGDNVISTELLKDTLLQPGESATVKVILRWINGEDNLGQKTNIAEISKDKNDKGVPDRDSTPDNKKEGEDDIDDAPVILTISTGLLEHPMEYIGISLIILTILGVGVIGIKKFMK